VTQPTAEAADPPSLPGDIVEALLDPSSLVRAVAAGRRRGQPAPVPERVDFRVVRVKSGPALQMDQRTGPRIVTVNLPYADPGRIRAVLAEVLRRPYASWRVETTQHTMQVRVTRKGRPLVHVAAATGPARAAAGDLARPRHDRVKQRLIDPDDPLFTVLGADAGKRRQVDAFLRSLDVTLRRAAKAGALPAGPLRMVDLGCGNAYLTMAAHRFVAAARPGSTTVGIELRDDLVARSTDRAGRAGLAGLTFTAGTIADCVLEAAPHIVLALHACDTATDEALAAAVGWAAPVILAAPCCHHDLQRQIAEGPSGAGDLRPITRFPILRERFADLLTDALRAGELRRHGYRVEVVEFVESAHTPRNVLIRAIRTAVAADPVQSAQLDALARSWAVTPALTRLLAGRG
jgi:hypothetical protein